MDHGWQAAIGLGLMIVSWVIGRVTAPRNDCAKCGISGLITEMGSLKTAVVKQSAVIRVLAERSKLSAQEQLEVENLAKEP